MQQLMNMAMIMAVISAVNPAASSLLTSNMARIRAVAQNSDQAHEEESTDNQKDGEVDN
jgi:DNA-binding FrmR family transcriptional regulator